MHHDIPSALIPYKFVIVPEGPLKGAWVPREVWTRMDNEAMGDMTTDALRLCLNYADDLVTIIHAPESDDEDCIRWKMADAGTWEKVVALAGMGMARFKEYDPDKRNDGDE